MARLGRTRDRFDCGVFTSPVRLADRRAGHGVPLLLKIYAHCIDGRATAANKRVTDALGTQDTPPESAAR